MRLVTAIKLNSGSLRKFAIENGIPYATLHDICSGIKPLMDCKLSTVMNIAKGLNISVDELLSERQFPQFRDALHNEIKQLGDLSWLIKTLEENKAETLFLNRETLHALYLVCMIDYVCNRNGLPLPEEYEYIRKLKLKEPFFIGDRPLFKGKKPPKIPDNAIPEFLRSNIVECNVYDAV